MVKLRLTARVLSRGAVASSFCTAVLMTAMMLLFLFLGGSVPQMHRQLIVHMDAAGQQHLANTTGLTVLEAVQWATTLSAAIQANLMQLPVERPNISSSERSLSSRQFEAVTVHSLDPPRPQMQGPAKMEFASRLVIGIAIAVHSGHLPNPDIEHLQLIKTTLPSFLRTAHPGYIYRFYLAFDTVDDVYNRTSVRLGVESLFRASVAAQDSKLWHPHGYQHGATMDPSALIVSLHWVSCPYTGKPAWAQSDAAMAAFKEGADYVFRTNDDTELPTTKGWETVLISDLRSRRPVPNLGVVGPIHSGGNTAILTHDFTHRTHAVIHGFHYPRSLPTWFADDWITFVYEGYFQPPLMVKRTDVAVIHTLTPQRYDTALPTNISAILQREIATGKEAVKAFCLRHFNVQPTK